MCHVLGHRPTPTRRKQGQAEPQRTSDEVGADKDKQHPADEKYELH